MLINTAVFGSMEVDEQNVFHLPDGLFGFDGVNTYALITKQDDDVVLHWFQAVDADVPCFVVFNPFDVVNGYQPEMEKSDLRALGCESSSDPDLLYFVIAVVPDDIRKTTVNLKSPIVLNKQQQVARQVILSNKDYPIRFSLVEE